MCYFYGKLYVTLHSFKSIYTPMKYLHPSGNNHVYESSLKSNNSGKYTASKQVKRNQTSERNNGNKTFIFHLFFLCLILAFSSCDNTSSYNFKSSSDALESYQDFHDSMKLLSKVDAKNFSEHINKWQELQDTVFECIKKDPRYSAHASFSIDFDCITDSIKKEFIRLSRDCTMKDVAIVKLNTSAFEEELESDTIKDSALEFYSVLDNNKPFQHDDITKLLQNYQNFLLAYQDEGITKMNDLKSFITKEDQYFRTFLLHIDKYSEMRLGKITLMTEQICGDIYREAYNEKIPQEEVLVYMSMRTVRRLLLNADICCNLLKTGQIKNHQQANAFLWMIIQPYLSIDSFAMSMLAEEQKSMMLNIAEDYSSIVAELQAKQLVEGEVSKRLPEQIMHLYITTL